MNKKLIALLIAITLLMCMTACSSSSQDTAAEAEPEETEDVAGGNEVVGGWELTDNQAATLPEEVQTAFDKATEGFVGSDLTPIAYFARQVVSGTNYAVLCKATTVTEKPVTTLQVAIIYADLEGNAKMNYLNEFDLTAYTGGEDGDVPEQGLDGGWQVPEDYTVLDLPEEAKAAFDNASEEFLGNDLVPMACLGKQIVSGTNYAILCHSTLTTADPVKSIQVVTVYEDLEGNATISGITTVDAGEFNE